MTNFAVIENRISAIKKYAAITKRYQKYSRQEIEKNVDIKGMIERYLYLTAQSAIDLAEAVISFKKYRKPTTMTDAFYILEENGVMPPAMTQKMIKMVGFRNILSHDYGKINYDIVYDVLHGGLKDVLEFADIISNFYK